MNNKMRTLSFAAAVIASAFSVQTLAAGQAQEVREALEAKYPYETGELVVQFVPGTKGIEKLAALNVLGAVIDRPVLHEDGESEIDVVKVSSVLPIQNVIDQLLASRVVDVVEPNWIYHSDQASNDPFYVDSHMWGMKGNDSALPNKFGSGAAELWDKGFTGSRSVYVGVIDEGVMVDHDDLAGNIFTNPFDKIDGKDNDGNGFVDDLHGWDFRNGDRSVFDGEQDDHGTHVAGTIGARGGNGLGVAGVNWQVTIIPAKFIGGKNAEGTNADAIKALNYMVGMKKKHHLNIVATNNSWGGGPRSTLLLNAINRAGEADILFVAAAGNDHQDMDKNPSYPAAYVSPYIISVAAINSKGGLALFTTELRRAFATIR